MGQNQSTNPKYRQAIIGFIICASVLVSLFTGAIIYFRLHHAKLQSTLKAGAHVGWSEQKVIEHLGEPLATVTSLADAPGVYSGGYFPVPTRKVSNKLLVFQKEVCRIYVYIDKDNKVEFTQLSRT